MILKFVVMPHALTRLYVDWSTVLGERCGLLPRDWLRNSVNRIWSGISNFAPSIFFPSRDIRGILRFVARSPVCFANGFHLSASTSCV
jgi:hypothetical protein